MRERHPPAMMGPLGATEVTSDVDRARAAFDQRAWSEAHRRLSTLDPPQPEDLRRLAVTAYMLGRDDESAAWWERAHDAWLDRGELIPAARCAGWLAMGQLIRGQLALGGGWLARCADLLDEAGQDCAERGFLLLPGALRHIDAGSYGDAHDLAASAVELGRRFADRDLAALGRHIQARALIRLDRFADAIRLFDELMVQLGADDLSPVVAGLVYCSAIEGCHEVADLRRAEEWTTALTRWCAAQPDVVPYRGQCMVHRAEILILHGAWSDAQDEIERAITGMTGQPAAGAAWYARAELHRLTGAFAQAEVAYRQASRLGRDPQPGLAMLRLMQGQADVAAATIRRVLGETTESHQRGGLLGAYVDIMLAAGDLPAAAAGAQELARVADDVDSPLLHAAAAQASGAVRLAEGEATAALTALRRAWTAWRDLDAAYEGARVRVLLALACRALGDEDGAQMELDAAGWVFQQLGAVADQQRAETLIRPPDAAGRLSPRELQVLRLVASGKTNRAIAAELFLSNKTVARHVGNIFAKLGVSSRSAATAYAYEHELV
jgi:ATP/maltotriose-dependent transcriptional regulator MalT